jgi:hypothetical protein
MLKKIWRFIFSFNLDFVFYYSDFRKEIDKKIVINNYVYLNLYTINFYEQCF